MKLPNIDINLSDKIENIEREWSKESQPRNSKFKIGQEVKIIIEVFDANNIDPKYTGKVYNLVFKITDMHYSQSAHENLLVAECLDIPLQHREPIYFTEKWFIENEYRR